MGSGVFLSCLKLCCREKQCRSEAFYPISYLLYFHTYSACSFTIVLSFILRPVLAFRSRTGSVRPCASEFLPPPQ
jgi:hypothetical protein